jgi:hypothetical protein
VVNVTAWVIGAPCAVGMDGEVVDGHGFEFTFDREFGKLPNLRTRGLSPGGYEGLLNT